MTPVSTSDIAKRFDNVTARKRCNGANIKPIAITYLNILINHYNYLSIIELYIFISLSSNKL